MDDVSPLTYRLRWQLVMSSRSERLVSPPWHVVNVLADLDTCLSRLVSVRALAMEELAAVSKRIEKNWAPPKGMLVSEMKTR